MQIKRQDLELIEQALARGVDKRCQRAHEFNKAAWELVKSLLAHTDPVDVVPIQDYPFTIGRF